MLPSVSMVFASCDKDDNDDTPFDWHEYEEGTEGRSFTFTYQIKDGKSLEVKAPEGISLGSGSFLRGEKTWYAKE